MFVNFVRYGWSSNFAKFKLGINSCLRSFSILENKLSFIDIIGESDDFEELDRNGWRLPLPGSIIGYTAQRQYNVGLYCGTKTIDGIQKLQVKNEHDCIHDIGIGSLNCLLQPPSAIVDSYTGSDLESIRSGIDSLYKSSKIPIDRIYSKFCDYDRFNLEQVIPYVPIKWRSKYPDIVIIGAVDRFLRNCGYMVERLTNNWTSYNEYRCQPRQHLKLLKANYSIIMGINDIFRNDTGFGTADCDAFVRDYAIAINKNTREIDHFITTYRHIINSLILLSNVYSPSEDTIASYGMIRDHILLPLFGKKDMKTSIYSEDSINTVYFHTSDILRALHILDPYFPPQFLIDSKCGYSGFTEDCKKSASRILSSFFGSTANTNRDETLFDMVDDYASVRSAFSHVAIAIDSVTTSEVDDSISIINDHTVAIHIADPTSFIPLGSDLDFNASLRSVTYYYPNKVYPLYPWDIATTCSLSTTQFSDVRPEGRYDIAPLPQQTTIITPHPRALTAIIDFNSDGSINDFNLRCTTLDRPLRLTYEEVDALLRDSMSDNLETVQFSPSDVVDYHGDLKEVRDTARNAERQRQRASTIANAALLGFGGKAAATTSSAGVLNRVCGDETGADAEKHRLEKEEVVRALQQLMKLARRRRQYREEKGCIDFSFAEARFHVKDGIADGVIDSEPSPLNSEELVMEMMVAAGEAIGLLGKDNNLPLPYRSHPFNSIVPADQMASRYIL